MPTRSRLRAIVLGFSCTALTAATLCTATAAMAAPAAPAVQHCTFDADTGRSACFATQDQAAHTTSGKIVVGKFFKKKNFGGDEITVTSSSLCDDDSDDLEIRHNFPPAWRDVISSVEAFGDCQIYLYSKLDQKGDLDGPYKGDKGYVGDFMNNRTESVGFK